MLLFYYANGKVFTSFKQEPPVLLFRGKRVRKALHSPFSVPTPAQRGNVTDITNNVIQTGWS